jgi:hypothetical protein
MAYTIDLLNAIRGEATELYKDRISEATQANIAEVGAEIYSYDATRNEFEQALYNKIAKTYLNIAEFDNPLAVLKRGSFEYGDTIEEIFVDLVDAQEYDVEVAETELFKRVKPIILAAFHKTNRKDVYKTTIEEDTFSQAFQSEEVFEKTIAGIVGRLEVSNQLDEFEIMKALINTVGTAGKIALAVVPNPVDEATAKQAVTVIKKVSNDFLFMDTKFNTAGVKQVTKKNRQVLLINTAFDALVSVEVLAYAFNMSKVEFEQRQILVNDFGGLENVVAMLIDERFFMVEDNKKTMRNVKNAQGLYENLFLHVWQVQSVSPFANAVLFVTQDATLDTLDLTRVDGKINYSVNEIFQLAIEADGSTDPYPPSKSTYTHDGTSEDTTISTSGLVIIGGDETKNPLIITATSEFDAGVSDTLSLALV